MRRTVVIRVLRWTGLVLAGALAIFVASGLCGEKTAAAQPAAEPAAAGTTQTPAKSEAPGTQAAPSREKKASGKKAKGEKAAKPRGRLPNYFSGVVNDEQREKIYAIQKQCEPKISDLRKELDSLIKARDEKINALLTPEQKKKIEDLKAAAKQSREKKETTEKPEPKVKKEAKEKKQTKDKSASPAPKAEAAAPAK